METVIVPRFWQKKKIKFIFIFFYLYDDVKIIFIELIVAA